MPVTMICPNLKCGRTVVAPDSARGKVVRCAYCHQFFLVPANHASATAQGPPSDGDKGDRRGK